MDAQIQAMVEQIKALGELPKQVAPDVARVVKRALKESIAAGTTPDGVPWKLRKDGGQPLENAARNVHVAAYQNAVFVRVTGPEQRHHRGLARGGIVREVIPTKSAVPEPMIAPITRVLNAAFEEAVKSNG